MFRHKKTLGVINGDRSFEAIGLRKILDPEAVGVVLYVHNYLRGQTNDPEAFPNLLCKFQRILEGKHLHFEEVDDGEEFMSKIAEVYDKFHELITVNGLTIVEKDVGMYYLFKSEYQLSREDYSFIIEELRKIYPYYLSLFRLDLFACKKEVYLDFYILGCDIPGHITREKLKYVEDIRVLKLMDEEIYRYTLDILGIDHIDDDGTIVFTEATLANVPEKAAQYEFIGTTMSTGYQKNAVLNPGLVTAEYLKNLEASNKKVLPSEDLAKIDEVRKAINYGLNYIGIPQSDSDRVDMVLALIEKAQGEGKTGGPQYALMARMIKKEAEKIPRNNARIIEIIARFCQNNDKSPLNS